MAAPWERYGKREREPAATAAAAPAAAPWAKYGGATAPAPVAAPEPAAPPPQPAGPDMLENLGSVARAMNPAAGVVDLITGQRQQGAGAALQQGVTAGWADELQAVRDAAAGAVGLPGGMPFDQSMQQQRDARQEFARQSPVTAGASELVGSLAGAGKIGAGVAAGRTLLQAAPRLAGIGAASGAVSGAGTADPGKRGEGAAAGALIGGIAGPAVAGGVAAGSAIGRALRNALGMNPNAADEAVIAALGRDDTTAATLRQALQDAPQGTPRSIAGVGGTNLHGTLSGAAVTPGRAQREVTDASRARMADQPHRVTEAVSEATGPRQYTADLLAETRARRWEQAGPLYEEAFNQGARIQSPRLAQILADPDVARAYGAAQTIARRQQVPIQPLESPDLRTLDLLKQGLDGEISAGFRSGNTAAAASLRDLRNEMVRTMDEQAPEAYRRARASYAGDSEVLSAIEQGAGALNMSEGALRVAVRNMSQAEREGFRMAALDQLNNKIADSADGRVLSNLLSSQKKREVIRLIIDDDEAYNTLSRRALAEQSEGDMLRRVNPTVGSQTALRNADAGNMPETAQAVTNAATGNVQGLVGQAMRWLQQRGSGLTDEQRGMMAQDLLSNDPARQQAVLTRIEQVARQMQAAQAAREGRRGGAAAVAGAVPGLLGGD